MGCQQGGRPQCRLRHLFWRFPLSGRHLREQRGVDERHEHRMPVVVHRHRDREPSLPQSAHERELLWHGGRVWVQSMQGSIWLQAKTEAVPHIVRGTFGRLRMHAARTWHTRWHAALQVIVDNDTWGHLFIGKPCMACV